jgi:apolipoprotein N-acyltransferase
LRIASSVAGGVVLYEAFPPNQLWWLAPIGIALGVLPLLGRRARAGFGYGFLFGLGWLLPLFDWLNSLLAPQFGPWPWLAMSGASAVLVALATAAMAVASAAPGSAMWIAGLFVADEALRQRFPFDGFPWGRVAFSQPSGAFLPLASLGGAPLLTFAVALCGAGIAVLARRLWQHRGQHRRSLVAPVAALLVPVVAGLATWPTIGTAAQAGTATVAAVQGSAPDIGLKLLNDGGVLWRNHVRQSRQLARDIRTGAVPKPDFVVLPESVVALRGTDSAVVGELSRLIGAPIALGARTVPQHGRGRNVVIGWNPTTGKAGVYAKQKLVPYGEYVPLRSIAGALTPFVNQESDLRPGHKPGVMRLGPARVGFAICYEVAFDAPLRGAVRQGAQVLAVPANNEWYGRTNASYQQLGMARVRAVEHGRAVVLAATTGVSAIIRPDGSIAKESSLFASTDLVGSVPLRNGITPADRVGVWSEWTLTALGLVGLAFGIGSRTRARREARNVGKEADGRDGAAQASG